MRRYSRFKICKTNFHFFFYSSRLVKFKRPKWNILKTKLNFINKSHKKKFSFLKYSFLSLYTIPLIFKNFKYYCQFTSKKSIKFITKSFNKRKLNSQYIKDNHNFDFSFHR